MSVETRIETPVTKAITTVINDLTGFIGNADVQKVIGLAGGAALQTDFKTWLAKLASVGAGGIFALGVHYVDYLRAKVAPPTT